MKRREFITSALIIGAGQFITGGLTIPKASAGQKSERRIINHRYTLHDEAVRDAVRKAKNFEENYSNDIFIPPAKQILLSKVNHRLARLQRLVGYANFNLISFDAARYYARHYTRVGAFSSPELNLIEELFEFNAARYGFFGRKVSNNLTESVKRRDVKKIKGSGHYLYRGDALSLYLKMKRQLGPELILTSGIRSVVKQVHLFIAKAVKSDGNLSRAARSLAPPGHSFHGIGDFDVGQRGLGAANFTNAFAKTELHHRLEELGLITMRYPMSNPYGVRHEPWHIKVVRDV